MMKKIWAAFREKYPSRLRAFLVLGVSLFGLVIVAGGLMTAGAAGLALDQYRGILHRLSRDA